MHCIHNFCTDQTSQEGIKCNNAKRIAKVVVQTYQNLFDINFFKFDSLFSQHRVSPKARRRTLLADHTYRWKPDTISQLGWLAGHDCPGDRAEPKQTHLTSSRSNKQYDLVNCHQLVISNDISNILKVDSQVPIWPQGWCINMLSQGFTVLISVSLSDNHWRPMPESSLEVPSNSAAERRQQNRRT